MPQKKDTPKKTMTKTVVTAMIGNTFEWYDFALFGYFAPLLGDLFFPSTDNLTKLLAVFAAFAVGYVFRPIGGLFFGHIGDKYGRKKALVWTILLMAFPTTIIGLLPSYESIGISASILLVLMRILQGLSMGGNYGGAITFTAEQSSAAKRGLYGSFASASCLFGILLGSATAALFSSIFSPQEMLDYAWRIPFLLGVSICIVGFYMRLKLDESRVFEEEKEKGTLVKNPAKEVFSKHTSTLLKVVLVVMLHDLSFYILFVYMTTYFSEVLGLSKASSFTINSLNLIVVMVATVFSAWVSDKIGRKKVLLASCLFFVFATLPLLDIITSTNSIYMIYGAQFLLAIGAGAYFGPTAAFLTESYPTAIRYSAISITTNISGPLFGGTAPMVVTHLISFLNTPLAPGYYLTLAALVSVLALLSLKKIR